MYVINNMKALKVILRDISLYYHVTSGKMFSSAVLPLIAVLQRVVEKICKFNVSLTSVLYFVKAKLETACYVKEH